MSTIKRWNGSSWVDNLPKKRSGSSWVDAIVRRYNGKSWDIISEKEYVSTWGTSWNTSYHGATNTKVTSRVAVWGDTVSHYAMWFKTTWAQVVSWNGLRSPHVIFAGTRYIVNKEKFANKRSSNSWMYQGQESVANKFSNDYGRQRSMIGFNHSDMRSKMSGSKIIKVELYLRSKHFANTSGGDARIGLHNSNTNSPASFSESQHNVKTQKFSKRDQAQWITLPNSVGEAIRDNKAKGLTLYANVADASKYGYFYGLNNGSAPQLRITYKK